VPELLDAASLVLMPSRREGLPLVAIQAAQLARPVIAARVGGLPEVVEHGQTGLLVPVDDAGALAEAVAALLEDPSAAARLGAVARQRAAERFGWRRYLDASDGLYRRLVDGAAAAPPA
jgi:glycosyltransferase involved in cell wall biosynthesis